jgi:hypothetical protein
LIFYTALAGWEGNPFNRELISNIPKGQAQSSAKNPEHALGLTYAYVEDPRDIRKTCWVLAATE